MQAKCYSIASGLKNSLELSSLFVAFFDSGTLQEHLKREDNMEKIHNRAILVVDDSQYNRVLFKQSLGKLGFEVLEAENGIKGEACFKLEKARIGLIVLDLQMPEQDGITTLAHIREIDRDVPVIILTGAAQKDNLVRCARLGIMGFFAKPLNPNELRSKVMEILNPEQPHKHHVSRVLLIDRHSQIRSLMAGILENYDCTVMICDASEGSKDRSHSFVADIVLVGLGMNEESTGPEMDFLKNLQEKDPSLRVIAYYNGEGAHIPSEVFELEGVEKVLSHPFSKRELLQALQL
ncbi:response regulator [bacterium]|nr:response regulator [bacterium]